MKIIVKRNEDVAGCWDWGWELGKRIRVGYEVGKRRGRGWNENGSWLCSGNIAGDVG